MNVNLLSPNFSNRVQNSTKSHYSNPVMPSKLAPLKADTVSFSGGMAKVSDFLEGQFIAESPRLHRIATTYLDVLESVAFKLKEKGFSFDRSYCELSPVKSPAARTSKIVRSGSLKVPDTIRATLYCNDPYDLAKLNDELIPMMGERGYVLAETKMSIQDLMKRGYMPTDEEIKLLEKLKAHDYATPQEETELISKLTKSVPDLDIRLDDVADQLPSLAPELRYSIGKPQKSGYEDIQMRFVRDFDKKKNPIQHELIILFGPNYSKAKHEESSRIYNYLRKLDELNVDLDDASFQSNSGKLNRYMDLIKQMFRGKVSQKLFLNGKNLDYADIPEETIISFSPEDMKLFEGYFNGLRLRLSNLHKEALKSTDIQSVKRQLGKDYKTDKALIEEVYTGLKNAIEHYNYQADLKK
ncbi:MAG: hypothetical protein K2F57_00880 [Candidatus Gastranaerophilales bacterium]|nr:hypothetical protein [Candidatus Gastranaerophilales bacterium]